jgi:hypothetical protein
MTDDAQKPVTGPRIDGAPSEAVAPLSAAGARHAVVHALAQADDDTLGSVVETHLRLTDYKHLGAWLGFAALTAALMMAPFDLPGTPFGVALIAVSLASRFMVKPLVRREAMELGLGRAGAARLVVLIDEVQHKQPRTAEGPPRRAAGETRSAFLAREEAYRRDRLVAALRAQIGG